MTKTRHNEFEKNWVSFTTKSKICPETNIIDEFYIIPKEVSNFEKSNPATDNMEIYNINSATSTEQDDNQNRKKRIDTNKIKYLIKEMKMKNPDMSQKDICDTIIQSGYCKRSTAYNIYKEMTESGEIDELYLIKENIYSTDDSITDLENDDEDIFSNDNEEIKSNKWH